MSIVDLASYRQMLQAALSGGYAYPAVNVHDLSSVNAAIEAFAEAASDGILQVYPTAAACLSGSLSDAVLGAVTLAEHARRVAERYPVRIALHTDHCSSNLLDSYVLPLMQETARRRTAGQLPLFNSHMFDGSDLPVAENLGRCRELLRLCRENDQILEIEVGVIGEEGGGSTGGRKQPKQFTTPEDFLAVYKSLWDASGGDLLVAPAFGNAHGIYKPGEVQLRPEVLRDGQQALQRRFGSQARLPLVFHGGSGSTAEEIREAIGHGVVKMNFDTDTQYAFTRAVADYMFKNYDGVLRIDGEVGVRQAYFQETWLARGVERMRQRVVALCRLLGSAGRTLGP